MLDAINKQTCAFCEVKDADVFWFNSLSCHAHSKCDQIIQTLSEGIQRTIDALYKDHHQRMMAHLRAVGGVRRACVSDTISAYLEKHGPDALLRLFDTVGVYCAKVPSARL